MRMIESLTGAILIGIALVGLMIASAQAVILNVDGGGQLIGAQDVDV